MFGEAISGSTAPDWAHIRGGLDSTDATMDGTHNWPRASQAVTATGAQTPMVITGLTNGNTYYAQIAQLDGNNNPSLTSTSVSFTPTATFTPASLGSNLVAWYEVDDISTLYQDTGCSTTPVTTDLQTVKCIKDKSGNGYNLTKTTGWVYHANGGSHQYLTMDGSQFSNTSSVALADANGLWNSWHTVNLASGSSEIIDVGGIGTNNRIILPVTGTNCVTYARDASNTLLAQDNLTPCNAATNEVIARVMTGSSGSGTVEGLVDNVGNGSTSYTGTPQTSGSIYLSGLSGTLFYGAVIAKGDQTSNRSSMQTYMAALHP